MYSPFPANTNVLYVDLAATEEVLLEGIEAGGGASLPGMIFNTKKSVSGGFNRSLFFCE